MDPAEALRAKRLRVTPQRRAILGAFRDGPEEHLSADAVHARAAAVIPEIGRGTVYATLAELTELGLLAARGSPEPVRYETHVTPHDHFRCRSCGRLFDVDLPAPDVAPLAGAGYAVEHVAVTVDGVCRDCGEYEHGLRDGAAAVRAARQIGHDVVDTLACSTHATALGPLALAASNDGVVRIAFEDHADFAPLAARARSRRGARAARGRLGSAERAIDAYLAGAHDEPHGEVDWTTSPVRGRPALEAAQDIGFGATRSYHRLGTPLAPYDVGYAIGSNPVPLLVPCHRVTCGAARPAVYVGGPERLDGLHVLEAG